MIVALDESYRSSGPDPFPGHETVYFDRRVDEQTIMALFEQANAIGLRGRTPVVFSRERVASLPRLQFIQKGGTGVDTLYDMDAITEHGILFSNNAGLNAAAVADHALLLALLSLHDVYRHLTNMRGGLWDPYAPWAGAHQLEGKTVGVVGMGAIGTHVARRFLGFGAQVVAYDAYPSNAATILGGVRWVTLDELLRISDVVTLHVPLLKETEGLIGARELSLMKRTAVLVNTCRGEVVDEIALYEALTSGRLRAAGLDVFAKEPPDPANKLLGLENVFATPHLGGFSLEQDEIQAEGTLDNIRRFLAGHVPLRLINPQVLKSKARRASALQ
ncbi:MAG: NAD(P)-dependent oxidoreductase [Deltaproteobacteria bacterium]|nr:NAD(P)-dependent oxidoreductase [Deltaproteobacteria bacterium]